MNKPDARLATTVYAPPPADEPWRLEDLAPGIHFRYYSFGRRALAQALRLARVAARKPVLLPGLICRDLLSSLASVGAVPVFYDVGRKFEPAAPPGRWPEAPVVLAVNYFGMPQDLGPFREYCAARKACLIEDNAHGLFSRDEQGHLLGTRGDIGIFSLRKSLPFFNGAALAVRADQDDRVPPQQISFGDPAPLHWRLKGMLRVFADCFGARWALRSLKAFRFLRSLRTGSPLPPPDPDSERNLPWPDEPCRELSLPIGVADPAKEAARRRSLYETVGRILDDAGFPGAFGTLPPGAVPYAYPFRCAPEHIGEAQDALAKHGLQALPWPDLPETVRQTAPPHYKDIWLVHFLW